MVNVKFSMIAVTYVSFPRIAPSCKDLHLFGIGSNFFMVISVEGLNS